MLSVYVWNSGQQRSTTVNSSQQRSTTVNNGQQRPTTVNVHIQKKTNADIIQILFKGADVTFCVVSIKKKEDNNPELNFSIYLFSLPHYFPIPPSCTSCPSVVALCVEISVECL